MTRDDTRQAMAIDHIGVDLWQAFRAFEEGMFAALVAAGYDDVTTADGDVLVHVGPDGTRSTAIAKSRRITKQAAQEQVQRLIRRGYLETRPDPSDGRARLVVLTARGEAMMRDLVDIKRDLDARIARALGPAGMDELRTALRRARDALG
ncbi:MAG: MarR family winged helix-turn-helix transcriptional regulator [Pseudomonadota bacterium]